MKTLKKMVLHTNFRHETTDGEMSTTKPEHTHTVTFYSQSQLSFFIAIIFL